MSSKTRNRKTSATNKTVSAWAFIQALIQPHKRKMLLGLLALVIVNLLLLLIPQLISRIIDTYSEFDVDGSIDTGKVVFLASILVGVSLIIFGLRMAWRYLLILPSYRITKDTKDRMFRHILSLCQRSLRKYSVGEQISLISRETKQLSDAISWGTLALADGVLSIILVYIILLVSYREMAWASLLLYPTTILFVYAIWSRIARAYTTIQEHIAAMSELTREMLQHIGTIKSFNSETYYINRFFKRGNEIIKAKMRITMLEGILWPILTAINGTAIILVLLLSIERIQNGQATFGDLSAVLNYLLQVETPFMGLSFALDIQQKGIANAKRIQAMLNTKSTLPSPSSDKQLPIHEQCNITLKNVKFTYPDLPKPNTEDNTSNKTVSYSNAKTGEGTPEKGKISTHTPFTLGPISLEIQGGQWLGITGKIGCGKSTLAYLLARIYDINDGKILYNDISIRNISLSNLHTAVLLQPQQFQLFSWSMAKNIAFSEGDLSDQDYKAIIKHGNIAGLEQDVSLLPHQWDTLIGESGILLSGGQKQRVVFARALITDTPILILDDIFSGIDYKNAYEIIANLRKLRKNKTTIIISHNLAILSNTEKIIVMEDGKIIEQGNHSSLLRNPQSSYAACWHEYLISQGQQLE